MKKILLVTDGFFHPPLLGRLTLHRILCQMNGPRLSTFPRSNRYLRM